VVGVVGELEVDLGLEGLRDDGTEGGGERDCDEGEDEDEIVLGRDEKKEAARETSAQRLLSMASVKPEFEGLRTSSAGHKIQDIKELMTVPVIVTADLTKSPPVIKVYSVNPYAESNKQ